MKKFRTTGRLRGPSTDSLREMIRALKHFSFDFSCVYFTDIVFEEESDGEVIFRAEGPAGGFVRLSDVDAFRLAAQAGPDLYMEADVEETEWITNSRSELHCRLEGGVLTVVGKETTMNEGCGAYSDYFVRELPCSRFMELFEVRPGTLAEKDYPRFIDEMAAWCDDWPFDPGFELFMETLSRFHGETSIDQEGFDDVCRQIMKGLFTAQEFLEKNSVTETETYRYDARTGELIG